MTTCTICMTDIPTPSPENAPLLAQHCVYDFDGDLDYIELAHRECAVADTTQPTGYWEYDDEVTS